MDIEKIAVVLHRAVLQKLQNEGKVPPTLNQDQIQASYDRTYDILQEAIVGRNIHTDKIAIQRDATLRCISDLPKAIGEVSRTMTLAAEEDTSESDIQNLIQKEMRERGLQDESMGVVPENTYTTQPEPVSEPANAPTPAPTLARAIASTPEPITVSPPPLPRYSHLPGDHVGSVNIVKGVPFTTIISSPEMGSNGLRWETTIGSDKALVGINRVRIPYDIVMDHPYLLLIVKTDTQTYTHVLEHHKEDWYNVINGKRCLAGIRGKITFTITDPDEQVISTMVSMKTAKTHYYNRFAKALIDDSTGIARSISPPPDSQAGEENGDGSVPTIVDLPPSIITPIDIVAPSGVGEGEQEQKTEEDVHSEAETVVHEPEGTVSNIVAEVTGLATIHEETIESKTDSTDTNTHTLVPPMRVPKPAELSIPMPLKDFDGVILFKEHAISIFMSATYQE